MKSKTMLSLFVQSQYTNINERMDPKEFIAFDISRQPLILSGTSVSRPPRTLIEIILENVSANERPPINIGVDYENFSKALTLRSHRYFVPHLSCMRVERILPEHAEEGTIISGLIPGIRLRMKPFKKICLHGPSGKMVSTTTSNLAGYDVCITCAERVAFTNWDNGMIDVKACEGKIVGGKRLTGNMLGLWSMQIKVSNGFGVFRVGAINMIGILTLFDIASNGFLSQVEFPASMIITNYIKRLFGDEAKELHDANLGITVDHAIALLLRVFGSAIEVPRVEFRCISEKRIAEIVLKRPGIFRMSFDGRSIEQPFWREVEEWVDEKHATDPMNFIAADATQDTIEQIVTESAVIPSHKTLEVTIKSPGICAKDLARIIRNHSNTRFRMGCWSRLFYLLRNHVAPDN